MTLRIVQIVALPVRRIVVQRVRCAPGDLPIERKRTFAEWQKTAKKERR